MEGTNMNLYQMDCIHVLMPWTLAWIMPHMATKVVTRPKCKFRLSKLSLGKVNFSQGFYINVPSEARAGLATNLLRSSGSSLAGRLCQVKDSIYSGKIKALNSYIYTHTSGQVPGYLRCKWPSWSCEASPIQLVTLSWTWIGVDVMVVYYCLIRQ